MRGKPTFYELGGGAPRNIPAYAGKTWITVSILSWVRGTSPRMRGKLQPKAVLMTSMRNIPAYAGKTRSALTPAETLTEHPRVCGENSCPPWVKLLPSGTSPRMRGKHVDLREPGSSFRNIPAYAGKTEPASNLQIAHAEHPRVCGENKNC